MAVAVGIAFAKVVLEKSTMQQRLTLYNKSNGNCSRMPIQPHIAQESRPRAVYILPPPFTLRGAF